MFRSGKRRFVCLMFAEVLATALAAAQIGAEPSAHNAEFRSCMTRSAGVQTAVVACTSEEAARTDRALNATYSQARARLKAPGRMRLLSQQRRWLRRRDRECDRRYREELPGQDAPVLLNLCVIDLTAARITELAAVGRR